MNPGKNPPPPSKVRGILQSILGAQRTVYQAPSTQDDVGLSLIVIIILIVWLFGAWWVVTTLGLVHQIFLPSPQSVFHALIELFAPTDTWPYWETRTFIEQYLQSMGRLLAGFLSGTLLGIFIGVIAGSSSLVGNIFALVFMILNNVPKVMYLSLFILWTGLGNPPVILAVSLGVFLTMGIVTHKKIGKDTDADLIESAIALGLKRHIILWKIALPLALPTIFMGLQVAFGRAMAILIWTEWIAGGSVGIGSLSNIATSNINTPMMFALIFVVLVTSGVSFGILKLLEFLLIPKHTS